MFNRKYFLLALISLLATLFIVSACGDNNVNINVDGDDNTNDGDTDTTVDGDEDITVDGDDVVDGDKDGGGVIIYPDGDTDDESDRIVGCLDDSDCTGSDYCDKDSALCKRRKSICETCRESVECGYRDDACLIDSGDEGICGYFCESDTDCDTGFKCEIVSGVATRQCVFVGSETENICCADIHCEAPQVCNPLTHMCYDGCIGNGTSACPSGQVCVDASDDDRNGHCADGCDAETPCPGGQVCVDGTCIEGDCAIKEHCPIEYLCDTVEHACIPGCEVDADCYTSNECVEGECVERIGCTGTWQCSMAEMCSKEVANDVPPEERGCCFNPKTSGTEECPNPLPEGPQKLCDACTDTQNQSNPPECGQGSLGKNYCVTLQDKDQNPIGDFCLIRWDCSVYEEGTLDEGTRVCPRGYSCIKINQGNEMDGKYCMADCTDPSFQ